MCIRNISFISFCILITIYFWQIVRICMSFFIQSAKPPRERGKEMLYWQKKRRIYSVNIWYIVIWYVLAIHRRYTACSCLLNACMVYTLTYDSLWRLFSLSLRFSTSSTHFFFHKNEDIVNRLHVITLSRLN